MIKGILFDMDGVVVTQQLDFAAIKREIFGDGSGFILERMELLDAAGLARANAILDRHETEAAHIAQPMDGVVPFLGWMEREGLRRGLVTRNSRKTVGILQERLGLRFDAIVTREDAAPKPSPEPVLVACRILGVAPAETVFIGDGEFDMLAGRTAGCTTVLLMNTKYPSSPNADYQIERFAELRGVVERLRAGETRRSG
jgi:HAD superfamily hydrolase (TIGR01509 family)